MLQEIRFLKDHNLFSVIQPRSLYIILIFSRLININLFYCEKYFRLSVNIQIINEQSLQSSFPEFDN